MLNQFFLINMVKKTWNKNLNYFKTLNVKITFQNFFIL